MSAIEHARFAGWLPHPGPEHTRAVISIVLFAALFICLALPFARLQVEGQGQDWSFSYLSDFGPGSTIASETSTSDDRVATELELLKARIEDVEDVDDTGVFQLALFVGLFVSGRARNGPVIGMLAAGVALSFLWGFWQDATFQFRNARWPLPVTAGLDRMWGLWVGLGLAGAALLWNIIRFRLDRRGRLDISGARS
jgi:hypothetical protein